MATLYFSFHNSPSIPPLFAMIVKSKRSRYVHSCILVLTATLLLYVRVASKGTNCAHNANQQEIRQLKMTADENYNYEDRALFGITKIKDFGAKKLQKFTEGVQTRYQQHQVNRWIAEGRTSDGVFRLLKLDAEGVNILKSPKLSTWMAYVSKQGKAPYDFLLFKLRRRYDNAELAKMLVLSKNDAISRMIAEKLETLQFAKWMNNDQSIVDVFRLLKLNEEGVTLLKSPVLSAWMSYVKMMKKDPYELLFLAIKSTGFDEARFTRMIGSAKEDINSAPIATKMEQLQLDKWSAAEKSGDDVFKSIELDKDGEKLFESPVWNTWVFYLNMRGGDSYDTMFSVLRNRLGDVGLTNAFARAEGADSKLTKDIAAKLEMDIWRMNGHTSDDLFNILKLNEKGDKILESPEFTTWVAYVLKLDSYRRTSDEFAVIRQLEGHYEDATLARMLASSKRRAESASTKGYFTDLQELEFKKWVVERAGPNVLTELVRKKFLASDSVDEISVVF